MLKSDQSRIIRPLRLLLLLLMSAALGACSAIRLGYANGPQLAWWWLDGYVDFASDQAPQARQALDRWFDWHRGTQLPGYAALLGQAHASLQLNEPLTSAAACQWQDRARQALDPALQRAAEEFAEFVPGLGEPQFRQLERRYAKGNQERREEYGQADPQARLAASVKRTQSRMEDLYGELSPAQLRQLSAALSASPFNAERWLQERHRRQQDTLQTLRRLAAEKTGRTERVAALRALMRRSEISPDPAYRELQQRGTEFNCGLAAQLHNSASPAQRQALQRKLKGWEEDLRWLAANPSGTAARNQTALNNGSP